MEGNEQLFDTNPETENKKSDSDYMTSKKIIRVLIVLIILLLIGLVLLLIFYFKKSSNSDSKKSSDDSDKTPDESPFEIVEGESDIQLIPKSGKYDYVLIFIHGMTGNSTENLDKFNKKDGPVPDNFKIILPCAPIAFVTRLNFSTYSWFDILGINGAFTYEDDIVFSDMEKSAERIGKIIENEVKNVQNNYTRIFVGGFSQGGLMSYHIGLSFEHTLGGIIPFCSFPITKTQINDKNIENLNILGIFGGQDIYVNPDYAVNKTLNVLSKFKKLKIEFFNDEPHQVKEAELEYVKIFIKSLL